MEHCVEQLTEDPNAKHLDHHKCLLNAATQLNSLRQQTDEINFDMEHLKAAIDDSEDKKSLLEKLWSSSGIKEYFSRREASSRLEEMMLVSSLNGPLTDFPPDVNKNLYSELISFGLANCPGTMLLLVDLLIKKNTPVQEKDVLRIGFVFSILAHGISRRNNSLTKVKSLLLQSQGLTVEGLDMLSLLGISESGRSTLNSSDLLAEVSDRILRESSKTMCSQSTIDNLDYQETHMTLEYKQFERKDTSNLNSGRIVTIYTRIFAQKQGSSS